MKKLITAAFIIIQSNCIAQLYDLSFNGTGAWNQKIGTGTNTIKSISLQPDGKILFCGEISAAGNDTSKFLIGRLTTAGALDNAFNTTGYTIKKFSIDKYNTANDVKYINGKIYAVGYKLSLTNSDDLIAKFNTDGTLDATFDSDGILTVTPAAYPNSSNFVFGTSTNDIVAIGGSDNSGGTASYLTGFKVDQNAAFVNSYGTSSNGIMLNTTVPNTFTQNTLIQPDDKILILDNGALARIDNNGVLDNTFGAGGIQNLSLPGTADVLGVALQKDGKIIVCGQDNLSFVLYRYSSTGAIDLTFGTNGSVAIPFGNSTSSARSVIVDTSSTSGKIFVAGYSAYSSGTVSYFAIARISPVDGSIEAKAEFMPNNLNAEARCILVQPDGKLIIAGTSNDYSVPDFIVARINANFSTVIAGVEEATTLSNGFNLFPNPASQNINVHSVYAIQQIRVIDVIGNEVLNMESSGNMQVDISSLPKGLYNFVITTDKGIGSKKVSVQ